MAAARRRAGRAARAARGALAVPVVAAIVPSALVAGHLGALTAAGVRRSRRGETGVAGAGEVAGGGGVPSRAAGAPPVHVLVPAHDEAAVIGATVRALVAQRGLGGRATVHVVADGCRDDTAALAAAAGAVVHDRPDPDEPGKGAALNWALGRIDGGPDDVIVVVDADTVADPWFLASITAELDAGAEVAQGRYGVLDADASSATALRWAALAVRHHLRPLGRRELGWSCGLFGNGMAFRRRVLEAHPWTGHLTEDAEMALRLLLEGTTVRYVPEARVDAEMPATLGASGSQHRRWEVGRAEVARAFAPRLVRAVARPPRGAPPRAVLADAALDLVLPPLSLLVVAQTAPAVASLALRGRGAGPARAVAWLSLGTTLAHVVVGLRVAGAPGWVWRSLRGAPRLVAWKLALLAGVSSGASEAEWVRTERNAPAGGPQSAQGSR